MYQEKFMVRALVEAKKGLGFTAPNPVVGVVIVKNNKIIATGYHKKAGTDHAEIVAIKAVKNKKRLIGAEMYSTLEPCAHFGQTPPCVEAIINCGIKQVYVGMKDLSKKVDGKGIKFLRKNKIEVEIINQKTNLAKEIRNINQAFLKFEMTGLPFVIMKAAVSLDGKIATKTGDSKWISNEKARLDSRLERSLCNAVLVGSGTIKADNPELAPHGKYKNKKLLRIILDNDLSTDPKSQVYRDQNVFVACSDLVSEKNKLNFNKFKIKFKSFGQNKIDIKKLLQYLGEQRIQSIFVEGGGGTHGSFYDANLKSNNLLDKIIFYLALKIIGGKNSVSAVGGEGIEKIKNIKKLKDLQIEQIDDNIKIQGLINKY